MEDYKKKPATEMMDKEIVFSKSVKAGKRIYYLDVKRNRKGEMFLTITESKKVIMGEGDNPQVNFEKHKIFLYQEDFNKFMSVLNETVGYINDNQEPQQYDSNEEKAEDDGPSLASSPKEEKEDKKEADVADLGGEIKLDIDF